MLGNRATDVNRYDADMSCSAVGAWRVTRHLLAGTRYPNIFTRLITKQPSENKPIYCNYSVSIMNTLYRIQYIVILSYRTNPLFGVVKVDMCHWIKYRLH